MENLKPKAFSRIVFLPLIIISLIVLVGMVWLAIPAGPMPEVQSYLRSDGQVEVVDSDWLTFRPKGVNPDTGLILYTGGRVDPRGYAPLAYRIAEAGYLVVLPEMPFNLAVFDVDVASEVIARYPGVQHWAVGGHSLGGAMAAQFAYEHPNSVQGLVLWAAYPPAGVDFSQSDLRVATIYGSRDAGRDDMGAARSVLPTTASVVEIEGGNHEQFGWYGDQPGDPDATVDREEQQAYIVNATIQLLSTLKAET